MTLIDSHQRPGEAGPPAPFADPSADVELEQALERHRRELHVHCYRMVGSYGDAEDLVQETLVRAWRHRDGLEPGSNVRAWLYRIATNVCIDAIRARGRRIGGRSDPAEATWLEPYPDRLLDEVAAEPGSGPESLLVARETIELAFIAAIQALPPRQRAALVLSAGLGWTPGEVAQAMEMSVAAVNSALQRARATLRHRLPRDRSRWSSPSLDAAERHALRCFIEIHERGDADAAAALMRDDIFTTMPPDPVAVHGKAAMVPLLDIAFGPSGLGAWRLVPISANRQPAAASYLRRPGDELFRAFKLDVLRVLDGHLAETVVFGAALFPAFGLPEIWSEELRNATFAAYGMGEDCA